MSTYCPKHQNLGLDVHYFLKVNSIQIILSSIYSIHVVITVHVRFETLAAHIYFVNTLLYTHCLSFAYFSWKLKGMKKTIFNQSLYESCYLVNIFVFVLLSDEIHTVICTSNMNTHVQSGTPFWDCISHAFLHHLYYKDRECYTYQCTPYWNSACHAFLHHLYYKDGVWYISVYSLLKLCLSCFTLLSLL